MSNPQLAEMDASMQAIVRRAYELGRGDALKKVLDVLNDDKAGTERLALMAPETPETEAEPANINGTKQAVATPWWAWPVR